MNARIAPLMALLLACHGCGTVRENTESSEPHDSLGGAPNRDDGEPSGPPIVEENPGTTPETQPFVPACPAGGAPAPLTDPSCPEVEPSGTECGFQDQLCVYPSENPECVTGYECIFGLWSPVDEACPVEAPPSDNNSITCPPRVPPHALPCDAPGLACSYYGCGIDGHLTAECTCGRWSVDAPPCPITK